MAKKLYDIAVKTGEYTNGQGETKARYTNVGAIMANDDGGKFLMLNRYFNPAGVPFKEGSDSILLSMFEPREQDGQGKPQQSRQQSGGGQQQRQPQRGGGTNFNPEDDDTPF